MREIDRISTKEYWNERTKKGIEANNLRDMIFEDGRFNEYEKRVRQVLSQYQNRQVLDVACGYGRYSEQFNGYKGIDFSEEMIKLANEKYASKDFEVADVNSYVPDKVYDVIFEINSLHVMRMTDEDFFKKFEKYAREAILCLEADRFTIYQIYRK